MALSPRARPLAAEAVGGALRRAPLAVPRPGASPLVLAASA